MDEIGYRTDNDALAPILRQIAVNAANMGADGAYSLTWQDGELSVLYGDRVLTSLPAPIKTGTVYNLLQAHLRRPMIDSLPGDIVIGPYRFEPRRASLYRIGAPDKAIALTDKEADILAALWMAPDKSLSRDALLTAVWAYAPDAETHTLETHIYRLRQKMERDPAAPDLLVNRDGNYILTL
jgi:DNA-binding response OmpR family regulator